jgi:hypothetical protein
MNRLAAVSRHMVCRYLVCEVHDCLIWCAPAAAMHAWVRHSTCIASLPCVPVLLFTRPAVAQDVPSRFAFPPLDSVKVLCPVNEAPSEELLLWQYRSMCLVYLQVDQGIGVFMTQCGFLA